MRRTRDSQRDRQKRQNESSYRSKERAVLKRKDRSFVQYHPELSMEEREAALAWLDGAARKHLTEDTKAVLRKHLMACRTFWNAQYGKLIKQLDATTTKESLRHGHRTPPD